MQEFVSQVGRLGSYNTDTKIKPSDLTELISIPVVVPQPVFKM